MTSSNFKDRISGLRAALKASDLTAFIVPSTDPHQSEYVARHWAVREWLTGFTGSAGTAVLTADQAGLWTDSRYFIQAEAELKASGSYSPEAKTKFGICQQKMKKSFGNIL